MRSKVFIENPWACDIENILNYFESDILLGLTKEEVAKSTELYGKNIIHSEQKANHLILFLKQFNNPMIYLLLGATIIAFFLGERLDAFAIISIVLLNTFIGYFQEFKASEAISALKKLSSPHAKVIREGNLYSVPSEDVVPGDLLFLEAGDYVTADSRVIESFQLTSDESPLTGESLPVSKKHGVLNENTILQDRSNILHAGCSVNGGAGKAIVVSTGMKTEIGKIAGLLQSTTIKSTPLQIRLENLSHKFILSGFGIIIIVIIQRYLENDPWFLILMSAISLAVAAIPEGLPTVVTLALALSVRRMTKRHAIIRNLSSVETLGSTDIICTDKTGTLTAGVMKVREVNLFDLKKRNDFYRCIILCNNASVENGSNGDATEIALLNHAKLEGFDINSFRKDFPKFHEWSFDSERKRMSVAVKKDNEILVLTKGAPDVLLDRCLLSAEDLDFLKQEIQRLTSKGYRLLAVAQKRGKILEDADLQETNLDFLGLISMADPPRLDTIDAIRKCNQAGIKVVMITGDHPVTAKAVAKELGISIEGKFDQVVTGHELDEMDDIELQKNVHHTAIYARVSPSHKLRIVEAFQSQGKVVAMTGDGVNDAPALKKAQIGVAMGKGGTEVARQASSMILTDDNFSTIVSAVEEGRAVYGNIKRTIQYLISTNLAEVLIVMVATFLGLIVPFTPISLLWINLVTDGFPSLALAAEPLQKNYLNTSIKPSSSSFFDRKFLLEIFLVGVVMTILCLGVFIYHLKNSTPAIARSYVFSLLVFLSLFRSFSCRSENKSFFKLPLNLYHLSSIVIPIVIQFHINNTTFLLNLFKIESIPFYEMIFLILFSFIPVMLVELVKFFKDRSVV